MIINDSDNYNVKLYIDDRIIQPDKVVLFNMRTEGLPDRYMFLKKDQMKELADHLYKLIGVTNATK